MFDILLKNARIIDGTGRKAFFGDIGIRNYSIAALGALSDIEAKVTCDLTGLCVAPGFIDNHSHSDWIVLMQNGGKSVLEQGITMEICGQCGASVAPLMPHEFDPFIQIPDAVRRRLEEKAGTSEAVFSELENTPMPTNMAMFIGQGVVRGKVMDYQSKPATAEEIEKMKNIVMEGMKAGALGLSSGLIYQPGSFTNENELIEIGRAHV